MKRSLNHNCMTKINQKFWVTGSEIIIRLLCLEQFELSELLVLKSRLMQSNSLLLLLLLRLLASVECYEETVKIDGVLIPILWALCNVCCLSPSANASNNSTFFLLCRHEWRRESSNLLLPPSSFLGYSLMRMTGEKIRCLIENWQVTHATWRPKLFGNLMGLL